MFATVFYFLTVLSFVFTADYAIFRADHPTVELTTDPEEASWRSGTEVLFQCRAAHRGRKHVRLSLWQSKTIHNRDMLLAIGTNVLTFKESVWPQNFGCWLYCIGEYEKNGNSYYVRSGRSLFAPPGSFQFYDSNDEEEIEAGESSEKRVVVTPAVDGQTYRAGQTVTYTCAAGPRSVDPDSESVYTLSWIQKKACTGMPDCWREVGAVLKSATFYKTSNLFDNELTLSKRMHRTDDDTRLFCTIHWKHLRYNDEKRAKSDDIELTVRSNYYNN